MIELFIEDHKIDLTDDIIIDLTYTSIDVEKPTAIKNSFSKTISLPGTQNNNDVFGNIFRLDRNLLENPSSLLGIHFDTRRRIDFKIFKNGAILESGYMQMNDIIINDNVNILYNITLYGGLGDFFYNLMNNEDGTQKTLADIYYKWKPVYTKDDNNTVMSEAGEKMRNVISWTSQVIARSYSQITDNDTGSDADYVTEDITAIPVYQGKYSDFKADTIAINVKSFDSNSQLPEDYLDNLRYFFDDSITKDDTTFSTIDDEDPNASGTTWALIKAQRDLEPFEARDLRVQYMNVGLKLSRFLNRISDPVNNGGYTIHWDDTIKNSPYWKYSWILLDKPLFDKVIGDNTGQLNGTANSYITWEKQPYDITTYANPYLYLTLQPNFTFKKSGQNVGGGRYLQQHFKIGNYIYWNSLVTVIYIYDGSTLKDTIYVLTSSNKLGYNIYTETQQIPEEDVISSIISGMSSLYGITISSFDFVNYKNIKVIRDDSTFSVHSGGSGQHHFSFTQCNFDYTTTYDNNIIHFAVDNTISDLRVNIRNYKINYYYNTSTDTSSTANGLYYYFGTPEYERTTDFFNGQPNVEYYLDQEKINCVNEGESGLNTTSVANKQVLFGSSETPYKYLTDFTKLLNLKYDYDKVNKVINILTEDKYYKNDVIDLSKDIDYSKQIKIIPTNTNTKWKELSLKNIDSYPNYLYSKKFVIPYGGYKYDTKYEFNADTENLFKDNIYKELIPYQLSTQFMNDTKGYPSILAAGTYDYTLYKNGEIGGDENTETINVTNTVNDYNFTPNTEVTDIIPKLALFNKEGNYVEDGRNSFVFLNGFYKNYRFIQQSETPDSGGNYSFIAIPNVFLTDSSETVKKIAGGDCYIYSLIYTPISPGSTFYVGDAIYSPYSTACLALPYFSKYLYNKQDFDDYHWEADNYNTCCWNVNIPNIFFAENNNIPFRPHNGVINIKQYVEDYSDLTDDDQYYTNISPAVNNLYICNKFWLNKLNDLYDKDCKTVTLYVRINIEPQEALKHFYMFEGCYWIISKIENYDITKDPLSDFHKITFVKVKNINNYLMEPDFKYFYFDYNSKNEAVFIVLEDDTTLSVKFHTNYDLLDLDLPVNVNGTIDDDMINLTFPKNTSGSTITYDIVVKNNDLGIAKIRLFHFPH